MVKTVRLHIDFVFSAAIRSETCSALFGYLLCWEAIAVTNYGGILEIYIAIFTKTSYIFSCPVNTLVLLIYSSVYSSGRVGRGGEERGGEERGGEERRGEERRVQHWTVEQRTVEQRTGQDRTRTGQDRTGQYNTAPNSKEQYSRGQYKPEMQTVKKGILLSCSITLDVRGFLREEP